MTEVINDEATVTMMMAMTIAMLMVMMVTRTRTTMTMAMIVSELGTLGFLLPPAVERPVQPQYMIHTREILL